MIDDWKCPDCEYHIRNVQYPVRCKCGGTFFDNSWDGPLSRERVESRGLGDEVAKLTKAVGIKPCGACKKRQQKLNELVPKEGSWANTARQLIKQVTSGGKSKPN